ncbi:MAG: DUF1810 domain-containing protein [Pirellula sp.]|nr:DUF1810 domain-containing protein [Pirellula sp.]
MATSNDNFHLERFVAAQNPVYDEVVAELRSGRKTSHWMWFVFPQVAGLGHSSMAQRYAISSFDEAQAYFRHPILNARLLECVALVHAVERRSAVQIFGSIDAQKLRSCLTLFELASDGHPAFAAALDKYYEGHRDDATLRLLSEHP